MIRRQVHTGFAVLAAILAALGVREFVDLQAARRANIALQDVASKADSSTAEGQFAYAVQLAQQGDYERAAALYKELSASTRAAVQRAAMFNLGTLHLREALKHGPESNTQWLPMIELAKQSFRNVLRDSPGHWDARYNLELTLRLAPEYEDRAVDVPGPPPDSERTISTLSNSRMELP